MRSCLIFALFLLSSAAFGQRVTMSSYNVRNGLGVDKVTDVDRVAKVLEAISADVVALQELDSVTGRSKGVDVLLQLAKTTGMLPFYSKSIDYDGGGYGVGLLSKVKPLKICRVALPGREEARSLLVAEFDNFIFCSTHLTLTSEDQFKSLEIIENLAKKAQKPFFVAGDFNFDPTSKQFERLVKNFQVLSNPNMATFPADKPNVCIDYIVKYRGLRSVDVVKSEVVDAPKQSDHRPVYIEIELKK